MITFEVFKKRAENTWSFHYKSILSAFWNRKNCDVKFYRYFASVFYAFADIDLPYCSSPDSYRLTEEIADNLLFHGQWNPNQCNCRQQCKKLLFTSSLESTTDRYKIKSGRKKARVRVYYQVRYAIKFSISFKVRDQKSKIHLVNFFNFSICLDMLTIPSTLKNNHFAPEIRSLSEGIVS